MPLTYIEWAPILSIPWQRRVQTLAVVFWLLFPVACVFTTVFLLSNPFTLPFMAIYITWMLLMDFKTHRNGGRKSKWLTRLTFPWRYFADFFPIRLYKTTDLDPSQKYIFGFHPHGAWVNFASDSTGFSKLFPGIDLRVLTLEMNFLVPFWRDWLMAMGFCGVSNESCSTILNQRRKLETIGRKCSNCHELIRFIGHDSERIRTRRDLQKTKECTCHSPYSIMIVVGGASEALHSHPGTFDVILRRRKGIFRLAYQHGASLVPVISFGENDVYQQVPNPPGSTIHRLQVKFLRWFGFSMPLFWGRGIFNYTVGLLPRRKAIHTVVGRPLLPPKQCANPSSEQIHLLREHYEEELRKLFNEYKDIYAKDRKRSLTIID